MLSLAASILLAACSQFSIYDEFQPLSAESAQAASSSSASTAPLTIKPAIHGTLVGGTAYFSAAGGTSPYTFSVLSGGAGGTINSSTGTYTAPGSSGTDTIQVKDATGQTANATLTVVAAPPLAISPSSLTLNPNDTYSFTATGGVPPYTYSLSSGSGSITSGGIYTAPATAPASATIKVTDGVGATAVTTTGVSTVTMSTFTSPSGPLLLSPATVTISENQSLTLVASGGTPNATSPYYTLSTTKGQIGNGAMTTNSYEGTYTAAGVLGANSAKLKDSVPGPGVTANITVLPAAPSNLSATAVSSSEIDLTWTNNTTLNNDGVYVYRAIGNGGFTQIATITNGSPAYADTGLSSGVVYVYKVAAVAGTGPFYQGDSNYAVATTP